MTTNSTGGQSQRLYFSTYNWDSFLLEGVECDSDHPNNSMYSQLFSQYGGASIYVVDQEGNPASTVPGTVTPVVYGHASTYSKDSDSDGLGRQRCSQVSGGGGRQPPHGAGYGGASRAGPHHSFWRSLYEQL